MKEIKRLVDHFADRVNINLREASFDIGSYIRKRIPSYWFARFYALHAFTPHRPVHFRLGKLCFAGSYFLGRCRVEHSILCKSHVRGDELKTREGIYPAVLIRP